MDAGQGAPDTGLQAGGDSVAELIDRAFHYRGDVTIGMDGGGSVTGYLFNRNAGAREPFVQLIETLSGREITIPYWRITGVLFTGRDAAAASVTHFEAFQGRQEGSAQAAPNAPRQGGGRDGD